MAVAWANKVTTLVQVILGNPNTRMIWVVVGLVRTPTEVLQISFWSTFWMAVWLTAKHEAWLDEVHSSSVGGIARDLVVAGFRLR
jgi:hypothetical protein